MRLNGKAYTLELSADELWAIGNVVNEKCIRFHPFLEKSQKTMLLELSALIQSSFNERHCEKPDDKDCFKYVSADKAEI